MPGITYSVIVPVFNSQETLEELYARIDTCFENLGTTFEVIFVDDGSGDNSWQVLTKLKEQHNGRIKAVRFVKNFGQHNAVFCGLTFAIGDFIITLDDDLQHPPEEIPRLIEKYSETSSELVYGCYKKKRHSPFRNLGSKVIKKSSKLLYNSPGEGSSFRMFVSSLGKKISNHPQNFVYIDELLMWYAADVAFARVKHDKRRAGKSGYSKIKLFKLTQNLVLYYTAIPLKIMVYGGFVASFASFILGIFYIIKKLFFHVAELGYTSIIVTILFSTGIIIFSLGIIGEYLTRIYMVQNKKPPYNIKQTLL